MAEIENQPQSMEIVLRRLAELESQLAEERRLRTEGEKEALRLDTERRAAVSNPTNPTQMAELIRKRTPLNKPEPFSGALEGPRVGDWLFKTKEFFVLQQVPEEQQISAAATFLVGNAMRWWRTHQEAVETQDATAITTWEQFSKLLKSFFEPKNAEEQARIALRYLKQEGSVRKYVYQFNSLSLQLPNMHPADKISFFISNLSPPIRTHLRIQSPASLQDAMAIAEKLDHTFEMPRRDDNRNKRNFQGNNRQFQQQNRNYNGNYKRPRPVTSVQYVNTIVGMSDEEHARHMKEGLCFKCHNKGHRSKQCRSRMSATTSQVKDNAR